MKDCLAYSVFYTGSPLAKFYEYQDVNQKGLLETTKLIQHALGINYKKCTLAYHLAFRIAENMEHESLTPENLQSAFLQVKNIRNRFKQVYDAIQPENTREDKKKMMSLFVHEIKNVEYKEKKSFMDQKKLLGHIRSVTKANNYSKMESVLKRMRSSFPELLNYEFYRYFIIGKIKSMPYQGNNRSEIYNTIMYMTPDIRIRKDAIKDLSTSSDEELQSMRNIFYDTVKNYPDWKSILAESEDADARSSQDTEICDVVMK